MLIFLVIIDGNFGDIYRIFESRGERGDLDRERRVEDRIFSSFFFVFVYEVVFFFLVGGYYL